jgi:hypothetical protein
MEHVMQKFEDPLNLRSLPQVSPPSDGWPAIEWALRKDGRRRGIRRFAVSALAAAATVTLVIGLTTVLPQRPVEPLQTPSLAPSDQLATSSSLAQGNAAPADTPDNLDALIALSQRLEDRLRHIRSEVGDLPSSAVVYQVELEDLVVQVDEELSMQPESLALWSQRVELLIDLERLYENRLRREYQQVASL